MANTISVNVVADVRNIKQGIDSVNAQLTGFQKGIGKVKSVMTGAFAGAAVAMGGAAIVGVLKDSIGAASDLNETVSKTKTIFGPAAADILNFGNSAAKALGMSKDEALTGVSTFGNFFNQIGIGTAQSAAMSKQLVTMSTDLASFNNAAPVDVMDALASATRGEYDALQKYIPTINAAAVQNEALKESHKTSVKELTNAEKATALYNLALQGQGKAAGDFARTSDGLANQQRILSAEWANAKTTIGTALLPIMTSLVTFLTTQALPAISSFAGFFRDNLWPVLQDVGAVLQATVVPAFQALVGFFSEHTGTLIAFTAAFAALFILQKAHSAFLAVEAAGGLVKYIASMNIVQTATKVWTAVQWLLNAAMTANPIGLVVIAIVALVAAIIIAWKHSETFRDIIIGAWNAIKTATVAVWDFIKDHLKTIMLVILAVITGPIGALVILIVKNWDTIKGATVAAWDAIKGAISAVTGWISGAATAVFNGFKAAISAVWTAIKTATTTAWNGIKTAVSTGISGVVTFVKELPGKIVSALGDLGSLLINAGKEIISGLIHGITDKVSDLKDKLSSVTKLIPDWKGPLSKDKTLLYGAGKAIMGGLINGIDSQTSNLRGQLRDVTGIIAGTSMPSLSPSFAGNGGFGAGATVINVTVQAPVGSNPEDIGRELDRYLSAYERFGGRRLAT